MDDRRKSQRGRCAVPIAGHRASRRRYWLLPSSLSSSSSSSPPSSASSDRLHRVSIGLIAILFGPRLFPLSPCSLGRFLRLSIRRVSTRSRSLFRYAHTHTDTGTHRQKDAHIQLRSAVAISLLDTERAFASRRAK